MPWQKEFPAYERNYKQLLDNLNLNFKDGPALHYRARLLKLVILRGWRMLKKYDQEDPEMLRIVDEQTEVIRKNLNLESEPNLRFQPRELRKMDWEVREIVVPAFSELYRFFKNIYTENNQRQSSSDVG